MTDLHWCPPCATRHGDEGPCRPGGAATWTVGATFRVRLSADVAALAAELGCDNARAVEVAVRCLDPDEVRGVLAGLGPSWSIVVEAVDD